MALKDQLKGKLASLRWQLIVALALRGGSALLGFAFSWLVARAFGADGVGRFSVALTTATLIATVMLAGLDNVLIRVVAVEVAKGRHDVARAALQRAVTQTLLFAIPAAIALFMLRDQIANEWIGRPDIAPFLGVLALLIPVLAIAKLASSTFRGLGQVVWAQLIDGPIGTGLAAAALAVALVLQLNWPPISAAYAYAATWTAAVAIGCTLLAIKIARWPRGGVFEESLLGSGLPILCVVVSNLFVDWFAMVILSASASPAEAGLFRVAAQLSGLPNLIVVAAESILSPVIAASYNQGDRARVARVSALGALATLSFGAPLLLPMIFAPEWMMQLFGAEFAGGADALRIMAIAQVAALATGPVGIILVMTKHERWSMGYGLAAAIIASLAVLWLVPLYGAMGAAYAITIAVVFRRGAAFLIVRYIVGIRFSRTDFAPGRGRLL